MQRLRRRTRQDAVGDGLVQKVSTQRRAQAALRSVTQQVESRTDLRTDRVGLVSCWLLVHEESIPVLLHGADGGQRLVDGDHVALVGAVGLEAGDVVVQEVDAWLLDDGEAVGAGDVWVDEEEGEGVLAVVALWRGEGELWWCEGFGSCENGAQVDLLRAVSGRHIDLWLACSERWDQSWDDTRSREGLECS